MSHISDTCPPRSDPERSVARQRLSLAVLPGRIAEREGAPFLDYRSTWNAVVSGFVPDVYQEHGRWYWDPARLDAIIASLRVVAANRGRRSRRQATTASTEAAPA